MQSHEAESGHQQRQRSKENQGLALGLPNNKT